jgi:hypothetical protein
MQLILLAMNKQRRRRGSLCTRVCRTQKAYQRMCLKEGLLSAPVEVKLLPYPHCRVSLQPQLHMPAALESLDHVVARTEA